MLLSVMSILTDSKGLEEPKDPETCHVFRMYELLASEAETNQMRALYKAGGYGYGHAKTALYELILTKFSKERARFNELMANTTLIDEALAIGAEKARKVAKETLLRVRKNLGY